MTGVDAFSGKLPIRASHCRAAFLWHRRNKVQKTRPLGSLLSSFAVVGTACTSEVRTPLNHMGPCKSDIGWSGFTQHYDRPIKIITSVWYQYLHWVIRVATIIPKNQPPRCQMGGGAEIKALTGITWSLLASQQLTKAPCDLFWLATWSVCHMILLKAVDWLKRII